MPNNSEQIDVAVIAGVDGSRGSPEVWVHNSCKVTVPRSLPAVSGSSEATMASSCTSPRLTASARSIPVNTFASEPTSK
ncbi:hypothetical protein AOC05_08645 [Arthrobacter alpinus]|uniref:Uncharacterized protein n=1 Tax=Arthrobacter alpinus TaxID=656366 RepID=A0A0M5LXD5_9MICC|nr:hypothetical protein [Arthrobacter sp. AQ5-05]ALE92370.1 hypothetical protein AOC05_08645 [Arthrobacter alpinus]